MTILFSLSFSHRALFRKPQRPLVLALRDYDYPSID
jgi:hypothetical protein